jgi:large subunit ribosomal protein L21
MGMYAVIKTGGKQYTVQVGDVLKVELLPEDAGKELQFSEVLMVADGDDIVLGSPFIANAIVKAEIVDHGRHKKIKIIKFRRRKHSMKQMGHRQYYSQVKITAISK